MAARLWLRGMVAGWRASRGGVTRPWLLPLREWGYCPGAGAARVVLRAVTTRDDSCEDWGAIPPTGLSLAAPDRLPAVPFGQLRALSCARPTDGMYACRSGGVKPQNTTYCGIVCSATTTCRVCGRLCGNLLFRRAPAADSVWTPCGEFPPTPSRFVGSASVGPSAGLGPQRIRNVRAILPLAVEPPCAPHPCAAYLPRAPLDDER